MNTKISFEERNFNYIKAQVKGRTLNQMYVIAFLAVPIFGLLFPVMIASVSGVYIKVLVTFSAFYIPFLIVSLFAFRIRRKYSKTRKKDKKITYTLILWGYDAFLSIIVLSGFCLYTCWLTLSEEIIISPKIAATIKLLAILLYGLTIIISLLIARWYLSKWILVDVREIRQTLWEKMNFQTVFSITFVLLLILSRNIGKIMDGRLFFATVFFPMSILLLISGMFNFYHLIKAISWYKKERLLNN